MDERWRERSFPARAGPAGDHGVEVVARRVAPEDVALVRTADLEPCLPPAP